MKILFFISFLIFTLASKGQDSLSDKLIIKSSLTSYLPTISFNTGHANIELEKPYHKNSILLSAGYVYSYGPTTSGGLISPITQNHTSGFQAGVEFRHYFGKTKVFEPLCLLVWPLIFQLKGIKKNNAGLYVSGQFVYQYTDSKIPKTTFDAVDHTDLLQRQNPAFLVKLGFQSINKYGFTVDQHIGFGAQYIYHKTNYDNARILEFLYNADGRDGFFPKLVYSFKIGYAFN
jgi:hypothetical protein